MTIEQGYDCMVDFLDVIYLNSQLDDLGSLLGSMDCKIYDDNKPADPAMISDWLTALHDSTENSKEYSTVEVFDAMIKFLNSFALRIKSTELINLKNSLLNERSENIHGINIEKEWTAIVKEVLKENNC